MNIKGLLFSLVLLLPVALCKADYYDELEVCLRRLNEAVLVGNQDKVKAALKNFPETQEAVGRLYEYECSLNGISSAARQEVSDVRREHAKRLFELLPELMLYFSGAYGWLLCASGMAKMEGNFASKCCGVAGVVVFSQILGYRALQIGFKPEFAQAGLSRISNFDESLALIAKRMAKIEKYLQLKEEVKNEVAARDMAEPVKKCFELAQEDMAAPVAPAFTMQ